jgi:UDP-3-O-acyl N-acetylglucosamine deacetylase
VRRTLAKPVQLSGVGLFSAKPCAVRILPLAAGQGILFRRGDLPDSPQILAHIGRLSSSPAHACMPKGIPPRNTTLFGEGKFLGASVATVEHLLSALAGLEVTDAEVVVEGPEIPILDGSSRDFVAAIDRAGLVEQAGELPAIALRVRVEVGDERTGASIVATPREKPGRSFAYTLDLGRGPVRVTWDGTSAQYRTHLAEARTFCTEPEARALQQAGLFTHVTPRDMLVLRGDATPIDNILRYPDEPARHKLLDLVGDLALLAAPIQADVEATRSGHALTHALCRAILASI